MTSLHIHIHCVCVCVCLCADCVMCGEWMNCAAYSSHLSARFIWLIICLQQTESTLSVSTLMASRGRTWGLLVFPMPREF